MPIIKIKDGTLCYAAMYKTETELIIPEGVVTIKRGAVTNAASLEKVSFPKSLRVIEKRAFAGCKSLRKIDIPRWVEWVGDHAFRDCSSLEELSCNPTTTIFCRDCFLGCFNLREYFNGTDHGRLFYFPKDNWIAVCVKDKTLETGVVVYKGKFAGKSFPSAMPAPGQDMLYFAVAVDEDGKEKMWYSRYETDAIEGAWLQARKETIRSHFGTLTPDTIVSPRKISLICGFCPAGTQLWCSRNNIDPDEPFTISDCLVVFKKSMPGAYRRLMFALLHQDDVDDLNSMEHFLYDVEVNSPVKLPSETRTVDSW